MSGSDGIDLEVERTRLLAVNERQRDYYDQTDGGTRSEVNSRSTNLWRALRHRAMQAVSEDRRLALYDTHRDWMGDLAGAKVLELGCGRGSWLSLHLAERAKAYHAIDLSAAQVADLRTRLAGVGRTTFHVGDFLGDGFTERGFDLIYAQSVLHHFDPLDVVIARLNETLAPGGRVITLDPLQTWLPMRLLRAAYRPFQTDAAWEHPFTAASLRQLEAAFAVEARVGLFDLAKWALALGVVLPRAGRRLGDAWFDADLARPATDRSIRRSLQISLLLRRRA